MGGALIKGLIDDGYNDIIAARRDEEVLYRLHERYAIETTTNNEYAVQSADTLLLGVKPQLLDGLLRESWRGLDKLWISIAAGKSIAGLEERLGNVRIIRAMPNLGSKVGYGATVYATNEACTGEDVAAAQYLFSCGGVALYVDENAIDPATILACHVGLLAKELGTYSDLLEQNGLDSGSFRQLTVQGLHAVAEFLHQGVAYQALYKSVASPGGATEAAERYRERRGFYETLQGSIRAALDRCKKLKK